MCKTRCRHRGKDKSERLNNANINKPRREDIIPPVSNNDKEVTIMFPRINDSNSEEFVITSKLQREFVNEEITDIFPFKSSHGIYFIRTVKKSYKGNKKDRLKLRLVIVDIKHNYHFSNRNGCDGMGIPKETILLSTGAEVSFEKLIGFLPEEYVNSMMSEFLAQDIELIQGIKRDITISNIQVLIEYLSKLLDIKGSIQKITYYERKLDIHQIKLINAIPEPYFYDFLRSRIDDPEISFESYMKDYIEKKLEQKDNSKRRIC